MRSARRCRRPVVVERSAFAVYRFPPEIILLAVRWYLRFGLSYRDVEELLAERGVTVDHMGDRYNLGRVGAGPGGPELTGERIDVGLGAKPGSATVRRGPGGR